MKCLKILVRTNPNFGQDEAYILHQTEYSFVTDVLQCSYHPKDCTCDATIINHKGIPTVCLTVSTINNGII